MLYNPVLRTSALAVLLAAPSVVLATDIGGGSDPSGILLLPGALDQPKINVVFRRTPTDDPIHYDPTDESQYMVNAFLDTGASGHLLSNETAGIGEDLDPDNPADGLGVVRQKVGGNYATFEDVGGGGSVQFHISEPLYMQYGPHTTLSAFSIPGDPDFHPKLGEFYSMPTTPSRTQIGPVPRPDPFDSLAGLDVVGMPAMQGKVVVMDNRGLNQFAVTQDLDDAAVMNTFIYNPGTAFDPVDAAETQLSVNPGIPTVNRRIKLSYANLDPFSTTSAGAAAPTTSTNPFVGKDPVKLLDGVSQPDTPGITVSYDNRNATGNFLLDTGAGASFISRAMAGKMGIHYDPARLPGDPQGGTPADPQLLDANGNPLPEQFQLTIAAFGADDPNDNGDSSNIVISGFYLDFLLVRTMEGDAANDNDPNHLKFIHAPILVNDISTSRLVNGNLETLTLDGVFGMNFLAATAIPPTSIFDPVFTSPGAFDWIVYNDAEGWLGVSGATIVPEPGFLGMLGLTGLALLRRRRGR